MKQAYLGGDVRARPGGYTVFGAGMTYEDFNLEQGQGRLRRSRKCTRRDSAGTGREPDLPARGRLGRHRLASVARLCPSRRALRSLVPQLRRSRRHLQLRPLDAEIVQHIPLLRENWVISLHGLVQTTLDDDDSVPYFLLPSLGGGSTLRGYSSWRFRDRHSLLMSGEFRWIPNRLGIDMAMFYDTGKVAPRWDDLSFKGLKDDVGIGIRFHGPLSTPLRIELAKGDEGMQLVFAGSAAF